MKIVSLIAATTLLSLGSMVALAQDDTRPQDSDANSAFDVIDRNGNGSLDKEEAENSGISDSRFESMDQDGDGKVSKSEYQGQNSGSSWQ
ncbi:MAG: EF-hand domain-containing protein [Natronospirillum sp.]